MGTRTRRTHPPDRGAVSTNNIEGGGVWDDLRFPAFNARLNSVAGHIDYNETDGTVDFDDSSDYTDNDALQFCCQMQHAHLFGSDVHPHIHWIQASANVPNWMIAYRWHLVGGTPGAWTLAKYSGHAITYSAGTIHQLTEFGTISPPANETVSSILQVKLFRDTPNTSTLFAGADPLVGDTKLLEFDLHYQIDALGSQGEYTKF